MQEDLILLGERSLPVDFSEISLGDFAGILYSRVSRYDKLTSVGDGKYSCEKIIPFITINLIFLRTC